MEAYKRDCYYYEEAQDMAARWCKCENCNWYISKTEAAKVVRNYIIDKMWEAQGNL